MIIEPTSGNTGTGLAMCCAVLGLKITIVMPESMSLERRKMIAGYGAKLVLTPAAKGMQGAVDEAKRLIAETPNSFMPMQFSNPANIQAHVETTSKEIFKDTQGKVDIVVAGIGTSGTSVGISKGLKALNSSAKVSPSNNTVTRDVILAVVIAVALVGGFAFLRFYLDDTVKHADEVEKIFGLPKTGRICKNDMKASKKGETVSELVVEKYPKSIVSENIKSLRTNLQFTAVDKNLKTILVTSTNASEGKSFVSANLAISFAQAEKKVLLVDCDLRKGRVHRLFDVPNTDDLDNLSHYIHSTSVDNLDIITCGTYPPNPSELLASKKNKRLLTSLRHRYDIIIFDGAPIGGLADSVILSSLMDETVIVVKDANTSRNDLIAAKGELEKVGAKVAGIVFNMVDRKSSRYYSYYYGHGYGYGESKNPKK